MSTVGQGARRGPLGPPASFSRVPQGGREILGALNAAGLRALFHSSPGAGCSGSHRGACAKPQPLRLSQEESDGLVAGDRSEGSWWHHWVV